MLRDYLKQCKELGGLYKNGPVQTTLNHYGLYYIYPVNLHRAKKLGIVDIDNNKIIRYFGKTGTCLNYMELPNKEAIVLSFDNKVYLKNKNKELKEFEELKDMECVHFFRNIGIMFVKNDKLGTQIKEIKILNLKTMDILSMPNISTIISVRALNHGVQVKKALGGYIYIYVKDDEIVISDEFSQSFASIVDTCQLNANIDKNYQNIYKITQEGTFEKVDDIALKNVNTVWDIDNISHTAEIEGRKGLILLNLSSSEPYIYPIRGYEIKPIKKIGDTKYYQIKDEKNVYLATIGEIGEPYILAKYVGREIVILEPRFDFKNHKALTCRIIIR